MYEARQGVFGGVVDWFATARGNGWRKELRLRLRRWTGDDEAVGAPICSAEVTFNRPNALHLGAGVTVHDEGVAARAHLGLVNVFVNCDAPAVERLARRIVGRRGSRDLSWLAYLEPSAADPPSVQWSAWVDRDRDDGGASWRRGCWFPLDTFLGRSTVTTAQGDPEPVSLPLPEKVYQGTARREVRTWKRPRWPGAWLRHEVVAIEVPGGIPIPGKGETGYDLDDDALYEFHHAGTVSEAVVYTVSDVLRARLQRAGIAWRPSPSQPAAAQVVP